MIRIPGASNAVKRATDFRSSRPRAPRPAPAAGDKRASARSHDSALAGSASDWIRPRLHARPSFTTGGSIPHAPRRCNRWDAAQWLRVAEPLWSLPRGAASQSPVSPLYSAPLPRRSHLYGRMSCRRMSYEPAILNPHPKPLVPRTPLLTLTIADFHRATGSPMAHDHVLNNTRSTSSSLTRGRSPPPSTPARTAR